MIPKGYFVFLLPVIGYVESNRCRFSPLENDEINAFWLKGMWRKPATLSSGLVIKSDR